MNVPRLSDLLQVHDLLEELFLAHQTALLEKNIPAAQVWLDQFGTVLRAHIADEELQILPRYEAAGFAPEGGKVEFFRMEHEKLVRVLGELNDGMLGLYVAGHTMSFGTVLAPPDPKHVDVRALIAFLDKEASFKDLLRHHDARERGFLYPLLEEALSEEEKAEVLGSVELREG